MKNLFYAAFLLLGTSCRLSDAQELKSTEKIVKSFPVSEQLDLAVYAINGNIEVESHDGKTIEIEVLETISSESKRHFDKGKSELKLGFEQKGNQIEVFIASPFDSRPNHHNQNGDVKYNFNHKFKIKVPKNTNLRLSTINDGDVSVSNVWGTLKLNNINGDISAKNAKGYTDAKTINGDVIINYLTTPAGSDYYTLNGDLKLSYPRNFAADCTLKTFQGEFYTDFDEMENMPSKTTKSSEKNGDSMKIKIDKKTRIKIGNGGEKFSFETFNGDVFIKKI